MFEKLNHALIRLVYAYVKEIKIGTRRRRRQTIFLWSCPAHQNVAAHSIKRTTERENAVSTKAKRGEKGKKEKN